MRQITYTSKYAKSWDLCNKNVSLQDTNLCSTSCASPSVEILFRSDQISREVNITDT